MTSKQLQAQNIDLNSAIALLKSLVVFVQAQRDLFDSYDKKGMERSGAAEYSQEHKRTVRRNVRLQPFDYCFSEEHEHSPKEKFRTSTYVLVIDRLV